MLLVVLLLRFSFHLHQPLKHWHPQDIAPDLLLLLWFHKLTHPGGPSVHQVPTPQSSLLLDLDSCLSPPSMPWRAYCLGTEFTFLPNLFFASVPLPWETVMCVMTEVWLTPRLLCVYLSCAQHFVLRPPTWQAPLLVLCDRWRGGVEAWGKGGRSGVTPGARLQSLLPERRVAQPPGTPHRRPCPSLPGPPHLWFTRVACCFHSPCLSQSCPLSVPVSRVRTAAAARPPSSCEVPASASVRPFTVSPTLFSPSSGAHRGTSPCLWSPHLFPSGGHRASQHVPQKVLFPAQGSPSAQPAAPQGSTTGGKDAAPGSLWPAAEQPRACRSSQELRESHIFRSKGALVAVACKAGRPREDASSPQPRVLICPWWRVAGPVSLRSCGVPARLCTRSPSHRAWRAHRDGSVCTSCQISRT